MPTGAFSSTRRRGPGRNDRQKEFSSKQGKQQETATKKIDYSTRRQQQDQSQSINQRASAEWDHRSFNVIVAKADEKAIGAGIEKMISERRLIASYNWNVDSWIPTIVVPGAPKIFYPWPGGLLEVRNQVMTIDEESYRIPNAPMEPLFTAVRLCQPNFKLSDVDLVADLNCLKKLLRFVLRAAFSSEPDEEDEDKGDNSSLAKLLDVDQNVFAGANRDCEFRIDGQVLGRTIVLMRRETEHRGRAMGYGVGYLDACTHRYDADPSAAGPHKRVTYVKYGGLRLLLRHKTLAAIYPNSIENGQAQTADKRSATAARGGGDGSWPSSMNCSTVRYARGGYLGDHTDLTQIEFASVSKERQSRLVIDKWLDMLFIGSDHLYFGEHIRGRFEQPSTRNRADALDLSGLQPSDGRRVLVILEMLLEKIVQFGRRYGVGGSRNGKEGQGAGDGIRRQNISNAIEPFSFAIVSSDECRKLTVFKTDSNNKNKRSDSAAPSCVSESMMNALLADDDDGADSAD